MLNDEIFQEKRKKQTILETTEELWQIKFSVSFNDVEND